MHACTIIARNYLPHARVLARSFTMHHEKSGFHVLVIDDENAATGYEDEPFTALGPYDIGVERAELHRMAMIYDVKELSTALKPYLLRRLLADSDEVAYFDPDIEIFASLEDLADLARERGIVLTPHVTTPIPRDGRLPDDRMILQAGVYNLGFIAVGLAARDFLEWWSERLARDCVIDVPRALFVDQRWVDFVPALFPHHVLRDPGSNVAYWNLFERAVGSSEGRYTVNGLPLRFFHFSGFDPGRPGFLSSHTGDLPRMQVTDDAAIAELCRSYAEALYANGYTQRGDPPYGWNYFADGTRIDGALRAVYRLGLIGSEEQGSQPPPDPFDETPELMAWLSASDESGSGLPRVLAGAYATRRDLQAAFPDIVGSDRNRFLAWAATSDELGVPPESLPPLSGVGRRFASAEGRLRVVANRYPQLGILRPLWQTVVRTRLAFRRLVSARPR